MCSRGCSRNSASPAGSRSTAARPECRGRATRLEAVGKPRAVLDQVPHRDRFVRQRHFGEERLDQSIEVEPPAVRRAANSAMQVSDLVIEPIWKRWSGRRRGSRIGIGEADGKGRGPAARPDDRDRHARKRTPQRFPPRPCTAIGPRLRRWLAETLAARSWAATRQRHRRARARLRRQFRSGQGARDRGAGAHAILALAEQEGASGRGVPRRLHRRPPDPRPGRAGREPRTATAAGTPPATVGAIGAAAACARLLRSMPSKPPRPLDRDQHGGRLHVAVRHHDQAAPRRPRRQGWRHGREPRRQRHRCRRSTRWTARPA
jgi:hypothetical protein